MGNPGWCLDGNGNAAYLHACGHGSVDYQRWYYTQDANDLQLVQAVSNQCLTASSSTLVVLGSCGGPGTVWDAVGRNGWVKLVNQASGRCLAPTDTGIPGRTTYPLVVVPCDPDSTDNVPTIIAWRYFA